MGLELSFEGTELLVGSDRPGLITALDVDTLEPEDQSDFPTGLRAFDLNATGTRLVYTQGNLLVQSINRFDGDSGIVCES